jgi:hypothetical protein
MVLILKKCKLKKYIFKFHDYNIFYLKRLIGPAARMIDIFKSRDAFDGRQLFRSAFNGTFSGWYIDVWELD